MPELPDLIVTGLSAIFYARENCEPYDLYYEIANYGYLPAGPFRVMVYLRTSIDYDEYVYTPVDSMEYEGMSVGESVLDTASVVIPPDFPSLIEYVVRIDDLEQVTEITEHNNTLIKYFRNSCPRILSVSDVPADGGGWAHLDFVQSWGEYYWLDISEYEVLRRIDPLPGCCQQVPDGWEIVGTVPATNSSVYTIEVPTAADSTAEHGIHWSVYKVRGVRPMPDTTLYYVSCPDSGYSAVNEPVATYLRSFWTSCSASVIEVIWELSDIDEGTAFNVYRRSAQDPHYVSLSDPLIVRDGLRFTLTDRNVENGESYRYRVAYIADERRIVLFETDPVRTPELPLTLYQNVPNPFNPVTEISYYLPENTSVTLEIYDVAGRRVRCLVDRNEQRGRHSIEWNGRDDGGSLAASGVYFYRLRAGKETVSKKMILMR
jgi:hypothetical protein